ncbi:hypothetical protein GGC47_001554 [Bosea sp. OAE752]
MLDIVAADQHELALPVEIIGIDDAQPWLALPTAGLPAHPEAPTLYLPNEQAEQGKKHQDDHGGDDHLLCGREFQSEQALQGLPLPRRPPWAAEVPLKVQHLGYSITLSLTGNMVNAWLTGYPKDDAFNAFLTMSPARFAQ